ncbi:hypothetical protein ACH5RR_002654 [Cinchona calisaya]|uniref:Protein kinase domain-containing protein n=1 Tax=Cinchona calisaya TaxID=153742 RepID=A0ABD3ASP5_9GENT
MKLKIKRKRENLDDQEVQENVNEKVIKNNYGDGVAWPRGARLGEGSFGSVYLAISNKISCFPLAMAVKSAELSVSESIQEEKEILSNLSGCPNNIIQCFGDEITVADDGSMVYNLLLEYASGGSLADRINKFGPKGLPESEVRCFTRSILEGLNYIHESDYVHRDLKPENILLLHKSGRGITAEFTAKLCDFGLSKRVKKCRKNELEEPYWRGTPMFLSPEAAMDGLQDTRSDIWSLGCIVLEMLTGKPAWNVREGPNYEANILKKLQTRNQLPKIPGYLSQNAKGFLNCCLERNVSHRLSAKTLLTHPFVDGLNNDDEEEEEIEYMHGWSFISKENDYANQIQEQSNQYLQIPSQNWPQCQYLHVI